MTKKEIQAKTRKEAGSYYTPEKIAASLVSWAVHSPQDRMLDPACGDGRFIARHRNSIGIEQDKSAAGIAIDRAPWALVHEGDFFSWASNTTERFDCAAGNPPFIRYQLFNGEMREQALTLCKSVGADFSGLASSWAPFLVATASLLKPGGRMAFVVPAELGHAPYAAPLLEYLIGNFKKVKIIAVKDRLFPELSEDCWLLYTEGFGSPATSIDLSIFEKFVPSKFPPRTSVKVSITEWRNSWNRRLRPYLLPSAARELYRVAAESPGSRRFGDIANIGIGYVSGANDFFHLRSSDIRKWGIPADLLHPTVRNGRALPPESLTMATVDRWKEADDPIFLLRLSKTIELPAEVKKYLDTDAGREARKSYKCRVRDPWYSVPDVQVPDFFLSYMSGLSPSLVRNGANCTCTNSVHSVRINERSAVPSLMKAWKTSFVQLSCELEGHPLGGGMLKLEPREATQVLLPTASIQQLLVSPEIEEAVSTMRSWRHYK